ncbi:unnamed protein product [Amoebophrya sp. A25]|nr:unnamed protein product [Amoebophrya sp. A25]|eukprot:GSA25T00008017001.1
MMSSKGEDEQDDKKKGNEQEGAASASDRKLRKIPWVLQQLDIPDKMQFFGGGGSGSQVFDGVTRKSGAVTTTAKSSSTGNDDATSTTGFFHLVFLFSEADLYLIQVFAQAAKLREETQVGFVFVGDRMWKRYGKKFYCQLLVKKGKEAKNAVDYLLTSTSVLPSSVCNFEEEAQAKVSSSKSKKGKKNNKKTSATKAEDEKQLKAQLAEIEKANGNLADQMQHKELRTDAMKTFIHGWKNTETSSSTSTDISTPLPKDRVARWWCNGRVVELVSPNVDMVEESASGASSVHSTKSNYLPLTMTPLTPEHVATLEIQMPLPLKLSQTRPVTTRAQMQAIVNQKHLEIATRSFDARHIGLADLWNDCPEALKMRLTFGQGPPMLKVLAFVDPLSQDMAIASAVFAKLSELFPTEISFIFNPRDEYEEAPLLHYYRQIMFTKPTSSSSDATTSTRTSVAVFNQRDENHNYQEEDTDDSVLTITRPNIFTLSLAVPDPWLVSAKNAEEDFDNLVINNKQVAQEGQESSSSTSSKKVIKGVYELRSMYMEGQALIARDEDQEQMSLFLFGERPAAGVELGIFEQRSEKVLDDARVLRNHGYFQLAANPGMYTIKVLPDSAAKWQLVGAPFLTVDSYITPPYTIRVLNLQADEEPSLAARMGMQLLGGGARSSSRKDKNDAKKKDENKAEKTEIEIPSDGLADNFVSSAISSVTGIFSSFISSGTAPAAPTTPPTTNKEEQVEEEEDSTGGADVEVDVAPEKKSSSKKEWIPATTSAVEVGGGQEETPVHIFTVASGHLYEKLLSIMILSVRAHTTAPLHFWFVDKFFSPKFKRFVPLLAERYKFRFSFISYKWPTWLHPQTEKQRLIWAYKILFLDVFFPLDVKRIIFIDADQIVRADVRELRDIDMEGNAYGMVPMGNTNEKTEGFRFWKQGYWLNHLRGKPYHISALFVVDLTLYRTTSSGDILRDTYNGLAQDPNSLANLDQDLPNFAQHHLPIFSLPKEWLWCETWCGEDELSSAKTIDLCQNPLTKEPKLQMARRIAPEWNDYHDEVVALQKEQEEGLDSQAVSKNTTTSSTTSKATSKGTKETSSTTSTTTTTTSTTTKKSKKETKKEKKKAEDEKKKDEEKSKSADEKSKKKDSDKKKKKKKGKKNTEL